MDMGVSSEYIAALKDEREALALALMEGRCSSYDDYRWKAGMVRGLTLAEDILHKTISARLEGIEVEVEVETEELV